MRLGKPFIVGLILTGLVLFAIGGLVLLSVGKLAKSSHPQVGDAFQTSTPLNAPSEKTTPQLEIEAPIQVATLSIDVPTLETNQSTSQPESNSHGTDFCASLWGFSNQQFGVPESLLFPTSSLELHTEFDYYYLAAMLIQKKAVDTTGCLYDGLTTFTTASMCGVNAAKPLLIEWQNKFDPTIFEVGNKTGIPPVLIKELFALESQFWPGYYQNITSSGLGQLNQNGADTLMIYEPEYFQRLCSQVLHPDACKRGYDELSQDEKRLLRGSLVSQVNADCAECPYGIDLKIAFDSIQIFADLLKANCRQVNNIVYNVTYVRPAKVISYVDLWRLTLANYNAGSGCAANALADSWVTYRDLDWAHVSQFFTAQDCTTALSYVKDIFP